LIAVSTTQGFQPRSRVKHAGAGVSLQQLRPARISQGIKRVDWHQRQEGSVVVSDGEAKLVLDKRCKCEPGALLSPSLDAPFAVRAHDAHLISLSPPAVDVARESNPDFPIFSHQRQMLPQSLVGLSCAALDEVIGMDEEARKAVRLGNGSELALPQVDRILVEDM